MTPIEDNATQAARPDCPHCGERSCVAGTTGGGLSCSRCGADVGMGEALASALAEVARLRELRDEVRKEIRRQASDAASRGGA